MIGAAVRERSLDHSAQYQRGVDSTEAEGVGEDVLHPLLPPGSRQKVKIAGLVRNLKIDRGRQPLLIKGERADRGLDRTRRAERVSVIALGSAQWDLIRAVAEYLLDRGRPGGVVERRRAAVGVDVLDLVWRDVGVRQRQSHRPRRLRAVR